MRRMMFYRQCLLMPLLMPLPLVLGVDRTSISHDAREFIKLLEWILLFGGVPYSLLAALLFYRSFRWTSREMREKLLCSPVLMIPFQYVGMLVLFVGGFVLTAVNQPSDTSHSGDSINPLVAIGSTVVALILLAMAVAIATLIVGYVYVLLGVCLEWIQERHGVIGPHDTVR